MPPTAYFLFASEHRAAAKAELEAQAGAKSGVAQVAKLIGAKWSALSDEEKEVYKQRAQQLKGEASMARLASKRPAVSCRQLPQTPYHDLIS